MTQAALASSSFGVLRDRLKARGDELDHTDDIDLTEALHYFVALPNHAHTPESVDALIELANNFFFAAQPAETLQAASLASRLAIALEQTLLLWQARGMEGIALSDLGRFTEAAVVYGECWELARTLGNTELEIWAIKRVAGLWDSMAQFDVAISYLERARELAAEHGFVDLELSSRNNIANCAVQLRDPVSGLRALLPFRPDEPKTKREATIYANTHDTLGHLYLLTGEMSKARAHAQESGRLAKLAGVKRTTQLNEALLGLIDVKSGAVEEGLAAVERALAFAKSVQGTDVADYLSMCIDAYETAGQSDRALAYLQELFAWKRQSIDAQVSLQPYQVLAESLQFPTGTWDSDNSLVIRAQCLHADAWQRIQHLVETAINAEIASGHDLYRTFRLAKLARCMAAALGWDKERINALGMGAQLCNIGMMAIPTRILLKQRALSADECGVLHDHTRYGAELLRKSRLQILNIASVIAEQHHERYDGSGYPAGLSGEAIAEEARIVAVCDAFDAMTHRRPWRPAPLSIEVASNKLKQGAGSQFDPRLVNAFVAFVRRECWQHDDFDAFLAEGADDIEYVRVRARMEALIADER